MKTFLVRMRLQEIMKTVSNAMKISKILQLKVGFPIRIKQMAKVEAPIKLKQDLLQVKFIKTKKNPLYLLFYFPGLFVCNSSNFHF